MARLPDPGAGRQAAASTDGAPDWLGSSLRHCSRCGAALTYGAAPGEDRPRHVCSVCGNVTYVNPRLVVTTLPVTDRDELVLIRRGIPPGFGAWAQPGGFLEADETAIEGAMRETREETGLLVEPSAIVGIYSRPQAGIVVVAFEAVIVGGTMSVTSESLEVRPFSADDIPWTGLAFETTLWAVRDWVRPRRPGMAVDLLGSESPDG